MSHSSLRIAFIVKPGHPDSGVGRYALQLESALRQLGHTVEVVHPVLPMPAGFLRLVQRLFGWDLAAFFNNFPVWAHYPKGCDIYHLTSQNLATLLIFCPPPGVCVVTVHDIIPFAVRHDPEHCMYSSRLHQWMDALAMRGLIKARWLVADSEATRHDLVDHLRLSPENIQIALLGILTEKPLSRTDVI